MPENKVGDTVIMRKPHPCGGNRWKIIRYGADVKLKCMQCGRIVMVERIKFKKNLKQTIETESVDDHD